MDTEGWNIVQEIINVLKNRYKYWTYGLYKTVKLSLLEFIKQYANVVMSQKGSSPFTWQKNQKI